MQMHLFGSQVRDPLETSNLKLEKRVNDCLVILHKEFTYVRELWSSKRKNSGYVIIIEGKLYGFIRNLSLDEGVNTNEIDATNEEIGSEFDGGLGES